MMQWHYLQEQFRRGNAIQRDNQVENPWPRHGADQSYAGKWVTEFEMAAYRGG